MKRKAPDGREYRHCEAYVKDKHEHGVSRFCKRAAAKGDRLCSTHRNLSKIINKGRYVITISKKGSQPIHNKWGGLEWPRFVIGKIFQSYEDAQLWADLNGSLIWKIPDVKSYCIEPAQSALKKRS